MLDKRNQVLASGTDSLSMANPDWVCPERGETKDRILKVKPRSWN
jgi:hypothetical protein